MPAAANGDEQIARARKINRRDHIGHIGDARDHRRLFVDHRVIERTRLVIARIALFDHVAAERRFERSRFVFVDHGDTPSVCWKSGSADGYGFAISRTASAVSGLPPMAHCPLSTSCTRTQVTPRIFSPSTDTIASVTLPIMAL